MYRSILKTKGYRHSPTSMRYFMSYGRGTLPCVVEAESYLEAEDIVEDAYYNGNLQLHADNSAVDFELENDTKNYIEIFGEEFETMEITEELR